MTLHLKETCSACPEQYDVLDANGTTVGYMRLRHGGFYAEAYKTDSNGARSEEVVYTAHPKGDGRFDDDERQEHLDRATQAIEAWIATTPSVPKFITIQKSEMRLILAATRLKLAGITDPVFDSVAHLCDAMDLKMEDTFGGEIWVAPDAFARLINFAKA